MKCCASVRDPKHLLEHLGNTLATLADRLAKSEALGNITGIEISWPDLDIVVHINQIGECASRYGCMSP